MTERKTGQQTVAGAYARIESHEDLCAERYRHIYESMADLKVAAAALKNTANKIVWLAASCLLGAAGWMAVQLYNGMAK